MSRSIVQSLALSVVIAWGAMTTCNVAAVVIEWNTDASGSFGNQGNWDPMQVPGLSDVVRFDRGDQSYTVSFGGIFGGIDRTNFVLVIADDAVTFDLQGATYELARIFGLGGSVIIGESGSPVRFSADTAALTIQNGLVVTNKFTLGQDVDFIRGFPNPAHGTLNVRMEDAEKPSGGKTRPPRGPVRGGG